MRIVGTTQGKMSHNPNRGKRHCSRRFEQRPTKIGRQPVKRYLIGG